MCVFGGALELGRRAILHLDIRTDKSSVRRVELEYFKSFISEFFMSSKHVVENSKQLSKMLNVFRQRVKRTLGKREKRTDPLNELYLFLLNSKHVMELLDSTLQQKIMNALEICH